MEIRVAPDGPVFMAAAEPLKHFLTEKLFRNREADGRPFESDTLRDKEPEKNPLGILELRHDPLHQIQMLFYQEKVQLEKVKNLNQKFKSKI